jgi:hypothetical protein
MLKAMVALIIGVSAGYYWGYGEGFRKEPSVVARSLDYFGLSRLKHSQHSRERAMQDAMRP